ncbi:MAG: hypothetical protein K6B14_06815 [Lachnospiraceae bacterium]|nr:hypothetical protein [Lachnospiraceae bacterium]
MGELIYCRHPIAANPLYIEDSSHNIYSLEELSYYIRQNPYLVTSDLMSAELCDWIRDELSDEELSEQLSFAMNENVPLHLFVTRLLSGCGYLTAREIKDTIDVIEKLESLSDDERKKVRSDELLRSGKLIDAIYAYDSILGSGHDIDDALFADICHNKACAYAWLMFFEEASENYEKAFVKNKSVESLTGMLFSAALMEDDSRFKLLVGKYHIPEPRQQEIKDEIQKLSDAEEVKDFEAKLKRLRGDYSDQSAYMEQLLYILSGFRDDYKRISKS